MFGVTPKAAVVRMRRLDAVTESDYVAVLRELARRPDKKDPGGSYYLEQDHLAGACVHPAGA